VSSGGVEPLSIAVSGSLVYVANAGASEPNVTGFQLAPNGTLYPLPGSTVSLPAGSGPDDVLFDPRGHKLVVDLDNTSSIASFHVRPDGLLVAAPGSPIAGQGLGPFGAEFRPTNPSQLFVSNAHNVGAGTGTVSAFLVAGSGQLAPIGASPFADLQTAPCWVEISHDGQFLFTVNTGSGEISRYSINPDGSLVLLGSTEFGSAGAGAVDERLSPDGKTLLVDGSKAGVIASFAVNGGSLTELASSPTPLPTGAFAAGIVTD
jgi:6-phosphogluconolactonase (cycloisomerase 2 family)